ncbi:VOC family protein [Salirhabdus salicampi]|uniref:VOC family protein n=1 Tax=Salirhabdus salicampi TaxID=476102 RepID=UPI0020C44638|nr:VOC family protein [Salirhabdus salicampi]MCP8618104.1 VOC family protein [Salirhabdus salicampi]
MLAFDHLVIATPKPEIAAANAAKTKNIVTLQGGEHKKWGTYNYLAFMENNSYIEWIGIHQPNNARKSDNPLIQLLFRKQQENRNGPIQYALRTYNMDGLVKHFRKHNIDYAGPFTGSRKKPDGTTLRWRMLFPQHDKFVLPFLIEWGNTSNRPKQNHHINNVSFTSIQYGNQTINFEEMIDIFQTVYQLKTPVLTNEKQQPIAEWPLENGILQVSTRDGIHATFDHLTFR